MFEQYIVYVVNNDPDCNNYVVQEISLSACTNVIVRINPSSNAVGPFDVYKDSMDTTPVYTNLTRQEILNGVVVQLGPCETYEMYIVTQDWIPLTMEDGTLWDVRDFVYPFGVSSGSTSVDACSNDTVSNTLYAVGKWENADRFYIDNNLTTPFNGGDLWWRSLEFGFESDLVYQIDSDGFITDTTNC